MTTAVIACIGLVLAADESTAELPSRGEQIRFAKLNESEAAFNGALAAHRRGDLDSARKQYEAAIEKDTSFVEAMVNLSRLHIERAELSEAASWLDRAEAMRSEYPELSVVRGLLALRDGRIAEAVESLSRARATQPRNVEILTNLAAGLIAQGRRRESIEILVEAHHLDPNRAGTVFNLGLAYDRAGDFTRATHHYTHFLQLAPRLEPDRAAVESRLTELVAASEGRNEMTSTTASEEANSSNIGTSLAEYTGEEQ